MKTGIDLITEERQEQIDKHKRSINADAIHNSDEQLKEAAIRLLDEPQDYRFAARPINWNKTQWEYMCSKPYKERLIIAGALIAAEIDRTLKNESKKEELVFGLLKVNRSLPTSKEVDSYLIDYTNKNMKEYTEDEKIVFRGGFRSCISWLKTTPSENG